MAEITYREALRQALREEMLRDERVFLMGEDIGRYGGSYAVTKGLLEEFGEERVKDTPISETAIIGAGIGAAMMAVVVMAVMPELRSAWEIGDYVGSLGDFTAPTWPIRLITVVGSGLTCLTYIFLALADFRRALRGTP